MKRPIDVMSTPGRRLREYPTKRAQLSAAEIAWQTSEYRRLTTGVAPGRHRREGSACSNSSPSSVAPS